MEVRRLSINGSYRFQQELIRGLFKCAIEVAVENDIAFLVDLSFHFVVEFFRKAGFEPLQAGEREIFEFGSPMRLIALNLPAREFGTPLAADPGQPRYAVNQCLRQRYCRRAAIRQFCLPERRRAWSLSAADIEGLCRPITETPPPAEADEHLGTARS
jgi:hypothetical protein